MTRLLFLSEENRFNTRSLQRASHNDCKRNGSTTLFVALNILEGTVIGKYRQKHRHQEFIGFLSAIEREIPGGKVISVILNNYATHMFGSNR